MIDYVRSGKSDSSNPSDNAVSGADSFSPTVEVSIDELLSADSPRLSGEDISHVRALAESTAVIPPIVVHRASMRVVDGMHRLRAARMRNLDKIEVKFFDGTPEEAFLLAIQMNLARGLPLSLAEREAAARRVIASFPHWSDRAIAARTGLAARTVSAIRKRSTVESSQLNARIGLDGKVRPVDLVEGRLRASDVIAAHPDASLRTVARKAGVSVGTARDVRQRLSRGESPIPAGLRPATHAKTTSAVTQVVAPPRVEQVPCSGDTAGVWAQLSKDPSLRFTDAGRALLRWLSFAAMVPDERHSMLNAVPGHSVEAVRVLAERCAEMWSLCADELRKRGQASA